MKSTIQTKSRQTKRSIINLQPIQLDVQLSQKMAPEKMTIKNSHNNTQNPNQQNQSYAHLITPQNLQVIEKYSTTLDQIIQNMLICLCDPQMSTTALACLQSVPEISQLFNSLLTIQKKYIGYVAVLNLDIIKKLKFILSKCEAIANGATETNNIVNESSNNENNEGNDNNSNSNQTIQKIKQEIQYWEQFIFYSITEFEEQIQKYGGVSTNTNKLRDLDRVNLKGNYMNIGSKHKNTHTQKQIEEVPEQMVDEQSQEQANNVGNLNNQQQSEDNYNQKQPIVISKAPRRNRQKQKQRERERERERIEQISSQNENIIKPSKVPRTRNTRNRNGSGSAVNYSQLV